MESCKPASKLGKKQAAAASGARAAGVAGELSTAPSAPARRHIVTARQFTRAAPLASELPVFQELRHRCCS